MKRTFLQKNRTCRTITLAVIFLLTCFATISSARPTSPEQALRVVQNWIAMDSQPLESVIATETDQVQTYHNDEGEVLYHIVSMDPEGFVIISGDDQVEPIIGFVPEGEYDASPDNPLGALVSQDLPSRVQHVRMREYQLVSQGAARQATDSGMGRAQAKWARLDQDESVVSMEYGEASLADVRVAPLVSTRWNQKNEKGGRQCYNLFTPNHYPCGCVATAFAQIMRFFAFETPALPTENYTYRVNDEEEAATLLGGDGVGGPYDWSLMVDGPRIDSAASRTAIGRLTHDAGITVFMGYKSGGSGTDTLLIADALTESFGYENAIASYNWGDNLPADRRNLMVNPNLDAGYPVALGVRGPKGGHAIVGDGYGYDSNTLYHHLNMGWGGKSDAWYNLPDIDSKVAFDSVYKCVYNIFPEGSGEIISGRITDANGNPINSAQVTARRTGGGIYHASTNAKGIYALAKIPEDSSYQISVTKTGQSFSTQQVTTLQSTYGTTVGNKWGVDFTGTPAPVVPPSDLNWLLFMPAIISD